MTERQQKFLDVLFTEAKGNMEKAAGLAGYSPNTSVKEITRPIMKEIREATMEHLAALGPKAVGNLEKLLDEPTTLGGELLLKTTKDLLDRAGYKPDNTPAENSFAVFILPEKKAYEE